LAEDSFALGIVVGLLLGLFVGLPAGYVLAQTLRPKEGDGVVALERDAEGRITAIVEKHL
jgi:hypothetical protein